MWIRRAAKGIFFSKSINFVFNILIFVFLTTSLSTRSIYFFKSVKIVLNLRTSKLSIFFFKLFELVGTLVSLLMSNL